MRRLKTERIDLYQLHVVGDGVPIEDSIGALKELQDAGKVRHIGVNLRLGTAFSRCRESARTTAVTTNRFVIWRLRVTRPTRIAAL